MAAVLTRPRTLALLCATLAVVVGAGYMVAAGAPLRYAFTNLAALALAAASWLAITRAPRIAITTGGDYAALGAASALLATALLGEPVDGVTRWVRLGPLLLQPGLILVPAVVVLHAARASTCTTLAVALAAAGLALQPDRATAGALAAALAVVLLVSRGWRTGFAFAAALAAFAWTLATPDALPAQPFVERVFADAFVFHPVAGTVVAASAALLLAPAVLGRNSATEAAVIAFGACWLALHLAALFGNYPTPLVGYGASSILGYVLSAALLPRPAPDGNGALARPAHSV